MLGSVAGAEPTLPGTLLLKAPPYGIDEPIPKATPNL
jgi:hypothetical protein